MRTVKCAAVTKAGTQSSIRTFCKAAVNDAVTRKKRHKEHRDEKMDTIETPKGTEEHRPDQEQQPVEDTVSPDTENARKEAAEHYDKYLRLAADFDNYKKRVRKDRETLLTYGNEAIIKDILPIVDSLERALDHASNAGDFESFVEGLKMILEKLKSTLAKHGVEAVEALGSEFDPNFHEAMMRVDSEKSRDNLVVEEFEKGYLLKGRLLRPSKVAVAKSTG